MSLLRRLLLSRLLLLCAALVIAGASAAFAASLGSGPVPRAEPLAQAIHGALSASPADGVSADITFTNHLLSGGSLSGGGSPLLSGGSGRLWASDGQVRLELQSDNGDTEIYYAHGVVSYLDTSKGTLYRFVLPKQSAESGAGGASGAQSGTTGPSGAQDAPSLTQIQRALNRLSAHANVSGPTATDVGGQPAYGVRVSPRSNGGLFDGLGLWWDSAHGLPLQVAVYAKGQTDPVLELTASNVSFGPIDPSVFQPPAAQKTVNVAQPSGAQSASVHGSARHHGHTAAVTGVGAVAAALPFTLSAPATLDGMPRTGAQLLHLGGKPAAVVFYGHGLGGIAVIERPSSGRNPLSSLAGGAGAGNQGDGGPSVSLPTVKVGGASATEIPTALGTLLGFMRGGVSYFVLGSVPTHDAVSAAQGL